MDCRAALAMTDGVGMLCTKLNPHSVIASAARQSSGLEKIVVCDFKRVRRGRFFEKNNLERAKGFEPSTSTLARWHSTTELRPR